MTTITILTLIIAISLQKQKISPVLFGRLTSIFFLYSAFLSFNVLYIESLGSGIGLYSGLYLVSPLSQSIDVFIYIIGAVILMPWTPKYGKSAEKTGLLPELASINNRKEVKSDVQMVSSNYNELESGANLSTATVNLLPLSSDQIDPRSEPVLSEYSLLLLFTTLGGSLLISSSDLVSMYLSIELQSFAVYLLATIYRDSESSTSAGLKYFLLGGLSSCFILLGAGLIYSYTGLTNLESIYSLVSVPQPENISSDILNMVSSTNLNGGYLLGITLIITGFLFKIAAAPFHNWAPDVYDEVPTIVTTWLTIMPKISIVVFLLELNSGLLNDSVSMILPLTGDANSFSSSLTDINVLKNIFLISSLLSLIIGTVVGLAQYKIKRLLAYSTISHVGFMLLALAVNTESSIESLIFYLVQYSITNLNTFLILLVFGYSINSYVKNKGVQSRNNKTSLDIKYISELKGQFIYNPVLSISFAICLFSMAGIPPLMGFFAKQQVLFSATTSGYFFLSIIAILVSVISTSYYLQIIKIIHFPTEAAIVNTSPDNAGSQLAPVRETDSVNITNVHSMTISALTLTILLFIINPSLILNSTHLLALTIFNT